jgi:hypothetical protein
VSRPLSIHSIMFAKLFWRSIFTAFLAGDAHHAVSALGADLRTSHVLAQRSCGRLHGVLGLRRVYVVAGALTSAGQCLHQKVGVCLGDGFEQRLICQEIWQLVHNDFVGLRDLACSAAGIIFLPAC